MQNGQRTQDSAPNKSFRHRAPVRLAPQANTSDLTGAAPSAARLAAEAAFACPQVSASPSHPAQVSVRRMRSASLTVTPAPEGQAVIASKQLTKEPRVFRLDAVLTPPSLELLAALPAMAEAAPHSAILAAQTHDQAVSHRIASDKRPGPVRHVIHALPELLVDQRGDPEARQPQLRMLMAELQAVSPDLAIIAQAQAFSLVDERLAREWQRLSRQLDELHVKVVAQMC